MSVTAFLRREDPSVPEADREVLFIDKMEVETLMSMLLLSNIRVLPGAPDLEWIVAPPGLGDYELNLEAIASIVDRLPAMCEWYEQATPSQIPVVEGITPESLAMAHASLVKYQAFMQRAHDNEERVRVSIG